MIPMVRFADHQYLRVFLANVTTHLLEANPWANNMLLVHQDKTIGIYCGSLHVTLRIESNQGQVVFSVVEQAMAENATIQIATTDIPRLLSLDSHTRMAAVQIHGEVGLIQTIGEIFKNIQLPIGNLLQPILGNILTHRIERMAAQAIPKIQQIFNSSTENMTTFLKKEVDVLIDEIDFSVHQKQLSDLNSRLQSLEKNMDVLRKRSERF